MATTSNYLGPVDGLSIYDTDGDRQDVNAYPTIAWAALNANLRVTDTTDAILDIHNYGLEVLPTNQDQVTLYIHNVLMDDLPIAREMLFHCQVKSSVDITTTTSLYLTGQPLGELLPIAKSCTRGQFTAIRSNILPLPKGGSVTTSTFTDEGTSVDTITFGVRYATVAIEIQNHAGNIIYVTLPSLINHLDFYKNSFVRSARNYIPDVYWRLDFEQSDPQYPMYKLLDALTNTSGDVMQLFSNWFDHELVELAPGLTGDEVWTQSTLTSAARSTGENMGWLAQFTGNELRSNITGTDQPAGTVRDFYTTAQEIETFLQWQLENSYYGRAAGTREAMIAATQLVLTGTKGVAIIPHYTNNAWKIQVQTLRSETQDFDSTYYSSDDILDVVADASPMGYEIFHLAVLFFAFTLGNVGLGRLGLGVLGGPGGYVPPDEPTGLTITAGGTPSTMLILTWVAPLYNGGDVVSGYVIRRDGSIIVANTGNGNVTYTNTGLSPGTAYSYTVAALNGAGAGDQSSSASASTDAIVPDAPTSLTAVAGSTPSSMIDLSWTVPAYTGGAVVGGYQITENRAGAGDVVIVSNTGNTTTTYARTGLDRVTSYVYKVKAINSAGIGAASNTATLVTAPELPGAPTGLTLTAGSPAMTVISLSWTAPTENGGEAIAGYRIKKNGSTIVNDTGTTATTYSATGLTAGATYTFAVAAINSAGTGGDSNVPSLTTSGPIVATGGTITSYGNYIVHTFTADGTFTITENDRGDNFDVLVVGGGGAGGDAATSSYQANGTGGGGGGQVATANSAGTIGSLGVTIGNGGDWSDGNITAHIGGSSSIAGVTGGSAFGGGYGAQNSNQVTGHSASGGGAGAVHDAPSGGTDSGPGMDDGAADGGNDGGASSVGGNYGLEEDMWAAGGGGGSDAAVGVDASENQGGTGGIGVANDYQTGSTQYYGAGGGGGLGIRGWTDFPSGSVGQGGNGGGGQGSHAKSYGSNSSTGSSSAGTANTGGGGGGGASVKVETAHTYGVGADGGSGIVIIRYLAS
jgi:hypothetical protein